MNLKAYEAIDELEVIIKNATLPEEVCEEAQQHLNKQAALLQAHLLEGVEAYVHGTR